MDSYVTGTAIRQLREAKHMTQAELAEKLAVSAKAISKWETARGLPDISLLEPLAAALGVSVLELMQGTSGDSSPIGRAIGKPGKSERDEKVNVYF